MNSLKIIRAVIFITALSIVTGCSDQITSSGDPGSYKKDEALYSRPVDPRLPVIPVYKFQIILKGYSKYNLNKFTTGLDKFYSIDIANLSALESKLVSECDEISVYSIAADRILDCHSRGFAYNSLTIENTGRSLKKLDVVVSGVKIVKLQEIKVQK